MPPRFKFKAGDICIFTNKSSSGYRGNDGKRCRIMMLKDGPEWEGLLDEPGLIIEFLDDGNSFGCRESELTPQN